jgi:hypothetical protein
MPKETPNRGNADVREELPPDPAAVIMPATPLVTEAKPALTTTPSATASPETPAAVLLKAPADHARDLKGVKTVKRAAQVNGEPEEFELFHWQHAAAEALHGWKQHEHHEAKPILLSFDDYKAALLAASHPITRRIDPKTGELMAADGKLLEPVNSHEAAKHGWPVTTDYEPHAPALSQHKGKA